MTAEGSVYQRKDGRWVAQYKDARGKTRYIYRKTKTEAKRALREALGDRDDNIVPPSKMSVSNLLDEWLEDRRETISHRTWINQESIVRCWIKQHIGSEKLCKLSGKDVQQRYRRMLKEGLSASTVGQIHVLVKQALRYAVRQKYIRTNPLDDVKPPRKKQRTEKSVLTAEQVNHLLDTVQGDRFECMYALGALCGLRVGEALSLRYEDLNLTEGTISIRRTLWQNQTHSPKTDASKATIKISARALDTLRRHAANNGHPKEGWCFATSGGNPVDASNFYKWSWKPTLRKAGLPESLTPHSLRHGTASLLLNQKIPLPIVSHYLRHSHPGITARVYAHMIDGTSGMAADGMDEALG